MNVEEPQEPEIPVTILTGFLGAGKTTLLNRILKENHNHKIAIIENEFGTENVDNDLLVTENNEQIVSMNNGCVCCTIRGDLSRILTKLRLQRDKGEIDFDYIVLETSGVANPGPVAQTFFMDDAIAPFFRLDGVVTVVDAKYGPKTLDDEAAARDQVGFADRILVSKCDLVTPEELAELEARLRSMNARAPIRRVDMGNCPVDVVLDIAGFNMNDVLDVDPNFFVNDHHLHHHVQVDVQHQPHPRVVGCHLFELQPEGEIHRYAAVAADDLDRLGRLLFGDAQLHGEAFGLERTTVLGSLPLLDLVGKGGREVVETADDRVNLFRGTQNLLLLGDIFLHCVCKTCMKCVSEIGCGFGRCKDSVFLHDAQNRRYSGRGKKAAR